MNIKLEFLFECYWIARIRYLYIWIVFVRFSLSLCFHDGRAEAMRHAKRDTDIFAHMNQYEQ